jgi:hypothetical protein
VPEPEDVVCKCETLNCRISTLTGYLFGWCPIIVHVF